MVAIESIGKSTVGGTKKRADIMVIAGHGGDKLTAQPAEPFLNRTEFAPLPGQEHPLSVFVQRNPSFGLPMDGACFYVCGDARRMAKDVDRALHDVIVEAGGCSPEQAAEYVARLKAEQRYRRDIY